MKYSDYPKKFFKYKDIFKEPTILTNSKIQFSPTYEVFKTEWSIEYRTVPVLAYTEYVPIITDTREWWALEHAGAGHLCAQTAMIATRFNPKSEVQTFFDLLAKRFYYALNGWFDSPQIDPALTASYNAELVSFDLHLHGIGKRILQESIYPVDAETVAKLTDDVSLVDICQSSPITPVILFLADNSD